MPGLAVRLEPRPSDLWSRALPQPSTDAATLPLNWFLGSDVYTISKTKIWSKLNLLARDQKPVHVSLLQEVVGGHALVPQTLSVRTVRLLRHRRTILTLCKDKTISFNTVTGNLPTPMKRCHLCVCCC